MLSTPSAPAEPEGIHPHHHEPAGALSRHASPVSLIVLGCVMAIGLSGEVGQPSPLQTIADGRARLIIEMPSVIRTGDFYEMRLRVSTSAAIDKLEIEVSPELWPEITINSMIPAPESESFVDGRFRFSYGRLESGAEFRMKVAAQINPRLKGQVAGDIRVLDGGAVLVQTARRMRVMP